MTMYLQIIIASCVLLGTGSADMCSSQFPTWTSESGQLRVNGDTFHLKGTSWFGFETPDVNAPHGLWSKSMSFFLDFLQENNFNALRLPFSVKLVLDNPSNPNVDCGSNGQAVCQMNALDLMEHLVDECADRGIVVMLDQHRLQGNGISDLWYDGTYTEAKVLESWTVLLQRFQTKWNVFALDLKNEPHGSASWGFNQQSTDWNSAAERIIKALAASFPDFKGLFFVGGVGENAKTTTPNDWSHWWGGNMEGVHQYPIGTGNSAWDNRVVYTPHVYGPSVFAQIYFNDGSFPNNLHQIWNTHFGFVEAKTGRASVIGEWGGFYTGKDKIWQDHFSQWLIENCQSDTFYWCLNPNSGDTGGLLLDDWTTPNQDKLDLLARTQPNPSKLTKSGSNYCLKEGAAAHSNCGGGTAPQTTVQTSAPTTPSLTTILTSRQPPVVTTTTVPIGGSSGGGQTLSIENHQVNSWMSNGVKHTNLVLTITNTSSKRICGGGTLQVVGSAPRIQSKWNLDSVGGSNYKMMGWMTFQPGQVRGEIGMIVMGDLPQFEVLSLSYC